MTERRCVHHDDHAAIAICSACEQDICSTCHRTTVLGFALCSSCEAEVRREILPAWETASSLVEYASAFPTSAWRVMFAGRRFFAWLPPTGGWLRATTFGVIARMIGTTAQVGWSWLLIPGYADEITANVDVSTADAVTLAFLAIPVVAPLMLFIHCAMLWASLRIFGLRASFRLALRIGGYSSAAYLLYLIPPVAEVPIGHLLMVFWLLNIELVAVRRYFPTISHWRVMGVVFLPFIAATLAGIM